MPPRPAYPSEIVARVGEALFGPEWVAPLARLTGTNERTARRIAKAAREGEDYPAASGLLAALWEVLEPIVAEVEGFRR